MDYSKLNKTHKKRIARVAAAKYVLLAHAVREYMRLTGLIEVLPDDYREEPPYKNNGDGAMPTPADTFYGMSSNQQEEIKKKIPSLARAAETYKNAEEEMLRLLPKYRHPMKTSFFLESMIFFSRFPNMAMSGYAETPLMMKVRKDVPEPMRSKILKGLGEGELAKGERNTAIDERDDA